MNESDLILDGLLPNPNGCNVQAQFGFASPTRPSPRLVSHLWGIVNELAREADALELGRDEIHSSLVALDRRLVRFEKAVSYLYDWLDTTDANEDGTTSVRTDDVTLALRMLMHVQRDG